MRYKVTCLTPTLVGDGEKLAPIDYMVWKDQINVLDQRRIFRLLSRGPRLDGYLAQLKKAEKLDFASWGGFAQNFAGRRIPFEHSSSSAVYERAHPGDLFIPTFASGPSGPYLPATAIKGALRTGAVFDRWSDATMQNLAGRLEENRIPRGFAAKAEESVLGGASNSRMRRIAPGDSDVFDYSGIKIYLVRVATLAVRGKDASGKERLELGWKSQRGSVDARHIDDSTPTLAEMANPGSIFSGDWREKSEGDRAKIFQSANHYAEALLARHRDYAAQAGLGKLSETITALETKLGDAKQKNNACLLSIGWGGGLLGKSAYVKTEDPAYRSILKHLPIYQKALQTGLPFPKTRRVVFENNAPASLPGWVLLEIE